MNRVTFFTKSDCSLCRSALYVIERVRTQTPFELTCVDISAPGNEKWFDAYKNDIPVVHLNGREVFRHQLHERRFRELLEKNGETP
jgi:glutaredoxin